MPPSLSPNSREYKSVKKNVEQLYVKMGLSPTHKGTVLECRFVLDSTTGRRCGQPCDNVITCTKHWLEFHFDENNIIPVRFGKESLTSQAPEQTFMAGPTLGAIPDSGAGPTRSPEDPVQPRQAEYAEAGTSSAHTTLFSDEFKEHWGSYIKDCLTTKWAGCQADFLTHQTKVPSEDMISQLKNKKKECEVELKVLESEHEDAKSHLETFQNIDRKQVEDAAKQAKADLKKMIDDHGALYPIARYEDDTFDKNRLRQKYGLLQGIQRAGEKETLDAKESEFQSKVTSYKEQVKSFESTLDLCETELAEAVRKRDEGLPDWKKSKIKFDLLKQALTEL